MATVIAASSYGPAAVAVTAAALAVVVGTVFRPAATLAVLLVVFAIALGDTAPGPAAVSGLCAAGYLVVRHTATITAPTVVAATGFMLVGLVATVFPLRVPWLPVLAPLLALGCYALVVQPYLGVKR